MRVGKAFKDEKMTEFMVISTRGLPKSICSFFFKFTSMIRKVNVSKLGVIP